MITIGHALLELVMVAALFFGLGDLLKQNLIASAIGILSGLFLLWMGFDIVRSAWLGKVSLNTSQQTDGTPSSTNPILAGILASITNPYWIL